MSVHYEALKSGRIDRNDIDRHGGVDRALREVKRVEAEQRNASTPYERTRAAREARDA